MKLANILITLALAAGPFALHGEEDEKTETVVAVEVGKVVKTTLRAYVTAYGYVEPESATAERAAAAVRVTAPVAGMVTDARAVEGQRVEKGALLFRLDDRVARANFEKARQGVEKARRSADKWREVEKFAALALKREQALVAQDASSQKKLEEVQQQLATARAELAAGAAELAVAEAELAAAETQLKLLQVEAPLAGTLLRVNVRAGETVDPSTVLAEMVDLERVVAALNVPAPSAGALKVGQAAEIFTENNAQPVAAGAVTYLSPAVDAKTGTVLTRVAVPRNQGLRPGQLVRVRIVSEERAGRLAVPRAAVYTDHDGQSTLSLVEGNVAKQKVVKVGLRDGDWVEVEGEGVTDGATVVTLGSYALPKETKVRVLNAAKEGAK